MEHRETFSTVAFGNSVVLPRLNRKLAAGSYKIEVEEEVIEGLSHLAYRRVEVRLFAPRPGSSEVEMLVLSPSEFDTARARDVEASPSAALIGDAAKDVALAARLPSNEPAKKTGAFRENLPLWGASLGVVALLCATTFANQQHAAPRPSVFFSDRLG